MNQSTTNTTESKFGVFYAKFNKLYYAIMPWILALTLFLAVLMLLKGVK